MCAKVAKTLPNQVVSQSVNLPVISLAVARHTI